MGRKLLKVVSVLGVALALGAVGIYIDAKPYQRERMWQSVHGFLVYGPDGGTRPK